MLGTLKPTYSENEYEYVGFGSYHTFRSNHELLIQIAVEI
jgi:hypothetical protein